MHFVYEQMKKPLIIKVTIWFELISLLFAGNTNQNTYTMFYQQY